MMVREMKMDLNVKSSEGLSPDTVLPPHQYPSNVKERHKKGKHNGKDEFWTATEDFSKIGFARFRSSSCKGVLSRPNRREVNIEMRRGSMYQSSEELKYMKEISTMEGRKKIEISRSSNTSFPGSIVDSLCSSDDEGPRKRSSVIYKDSHLNSPSVSRSPVCMNSNFSDGFIEIYISPDVRDRYSSATVGRDSINSKVRNGKVSGSLVDSDDPPLEKDKVHALQKSFSVKVEVSHLLSPLESDCSSKASPKIQSTPIRKMFKPFTKSKSLTSPPLSRMLEASEVRSTGTVNITRNRTYQKALQNDFTNTAKHSDIISEFINRDIQHSGIASSPVHLHGNLKLENKHGVPFFEFKVKCPDDLLVAKKWRVDNNAFNWVYTFHFIDGRKKSDATGLGSHDCDRGSSTIAQMLVSCNLCSQLKDGAFDNCMVSEFVLYDLANSRQSASLQKDSSCDQDDSKTSKARFRERNTRAGPGNSCKLHPNLEIAAIVLQIPFHKREGLKYTRGNRKSAKAQTDLSGHSMVEQRRRSLHDIRSREQVKVVIATGNHGLPIAESQGPSRLLDRWRHGGGCDCGGWDMACPLILLGNPSIQFAEEHSHLENSQPLELFAQGAKQNCPTFSMTVVEEGQYAVDFHAQLSTLQAFSICIAILHGTCTFHGSEQEKRQELSQCNSLKMVIKDKVEFLIDSVPSEKKTVSMTPKGNPRSYVLNPPFSPIARV